MAFIFQALGEQPQVERVAVAGNRIGCCFTQLGDQRGFQRAGRLEALLRGIFDADMEEGSHSRVVAGNAQPVQEIQRLAQGRGLETGADHQFVGSDAFVGRGDHQNLQQIQVFFPLFRRRDAACQLAFGFGQILDPQRGRENLHAVFLAPHEAGFFQPGDGGTNAGVVGGDVTLEAALLVFIQYFARGGDDGLVAVLLALNLAQGAQHALDVAPRQAGVGRHAVLAFDVVGGVEQHATRRRPVAPGPTGFLQVVFQRTGNVGMDHQSHVGLVDTHAEGVGGGDDAQFAGDEGFLRVLLGFRRQAGVIGRGRQAFLPEKLRQLFGLLARGAVGDGTAGFLCRQLVGDQAADQIVFFARRSRDDVETQVVAPGAAVEHAHGDTQLVAEVPDDVGDDFRLGGGRQALDQRQRLVRRGVAAFGDEAGDVAVIRPEILAPFRQAMRLVENPGADFPLRQHLAHAAIAQLLGGDEQDADIPQAHAVEHVGPFRHVEQPVDRRAAVDAALAQALDLVLHQRDQRRDDDR